MKRIESAESWASAWNAPPTSRKKLPAAEQLLEVATLVHQTLGSLGFALFRNAGHPLFEYRSGPWIQEIVFTPGPQMWKRPELPFAVQVHASSTAVAQVRSRYWRPAIRAPLSVASGNLGLLSFPPCLYLFSAAEPEQCAGLLSRLLVSEALTWFNTFRAPLNLKARLYEDSMPMVSRSTALELLLAEFDPFEARRFLQSAGGRQTHAGGPIEEVHGFDTDQRRLEPIHAYYRLG